MEIQEQPQLYSTETGEALNVAPDQIGALIQSGKAAFLKGAQVPVLDSSGQALSLAAEDLPRALSEGYQYEPVEAQQQRALKAEYGDSPIRAGLEGAARGLTLGLSDYALQGLGADKEGLAARKELNPIASTIGEFGGAAIPALLTGGESAAVQGATKAGLATRIAELTPAGLASKAGTAVTEALGGELGTEATKTLAGKIAKSVIPMAAGSAVEGAIYSSGNVISESALGDPDQVAEHAIAQIGMGAALGGGLGAIVGAAASAFPKLKKPVVSALDDGTVVGPAEVMEKAVESPLIRDVDKGAVRAGLTKLKPNVKEIDAAAADLGVPAFPAQRSGSKAVQMADSIVSNSVSPIGVAQQHLYGQAIDKVENQLQHSLGKATAQSEVELGNTLKQRLTEKFESASKPISELYDTIKAQTEHVPVSDVAKRVIAANLKKETQQFTIGIEKKVGDAILNNLDNLKTVDDLKRFTTQLYKEFPMNKGDVARFAEKLDNLQEASVTRFAEKFAAETKDPATRDVITGLLAQKKEVDASYKAFRSKMEDVGEALGKKRIKGPKDFIEFLEDATPEKLSSKLFTKNNAEFMQRFAKEFPEEAQLLFQHEKNKIRDAYEKTGRFSTIFKEVDKLPKEVRSLVFHPEELKTINAARTYVESMPENFNRSFTSHTDSAKEFFSSPKGSIIGTARDYALKKFVDSAAYADNATAGTLKTLEDFSQRITSDITGAVKTFISRSAPIGTYSAVKAFQPEKQEKKEDLQKFYQKQSKHIIDAATNPDSLIDKTQKAFESINEGAPKIAAAAAQKATMAAMFLYDKMPKNPNQGDFMFANKKWAPSDFEVAKWRKYVQTVEDPMRALKDLKAGKLTSEQAETIQQVYPAIHKQIVQTFMEELPKLKEELPYKKRLQLSALFGLPSDPSLKPEFIQQMQTQHMAATQNESQMPGGGGKVSKPAMRDMSKADSFMSGTERVMTRA